MARSLFGAAYNQGITTTFSYQPIGGSNVGTTTAADEEKIQHPIGVGGTVQCIGFSSNATGAGREGYMRVNGANTNMYRVANSSDWGSVSNSYADPHNAYGSIVVVAGDKLSLGSKVTTTTMRQTAIWAQFDSGFGANAVTMYQLTDIANYGYTGGSGGRSFPICGHSGLYTTSNVLARHQFSHDGTVQNAYCYVSENARTTNSTMTLYANGAATTIQMLIQPGQTGFFYDNSNTYTVSGLAELHWRHDNLAGTENLFFTSTGFTFKSTSNTSEIVARHGTGLSRTNPSANHHYPILGRGIASVLTAAEASVDIRPGIKGQITGFKVQVSSPTHDVTFYLRKNGTDALSILQPTSNTAGWVSNNTTVDIDVDDTLNIMLSSNTLGTITFYSSVITINDQSDAEQPAYVFGAAL